MIRPALLAALLVSQTAVAQTQWTAPAEIGNDPPPPAAEKPEAKPVAAFGAEHPDCAEWTDGCIVCKRESDGPACSMPGIACLPAEPACVKTVRQNDPTATKAQ